MLDDTYNLRRWENRHVALGITDRPDLQLQVAANREDKQALNKLCEQAKEYAGTARNSSIGTTLHDVTERADRGEAVPILPDPYQSSIEAYHEATQMLVPAAIEQFVVCDYLGVAGTLDRLYETAASELLTVGDIKTGRINYGIVKIAVQFAIYSRSKLYDVDTGERTDVNIDQDWGVIVHLPAGKGTCELVWVNLNMGWELALLAQDVRDSRKLGLKDLTKPVHLEDLI